jgi:hypothetical protein
MDGPERSGVAPPRVARWIISRVAGGDRWPELDAELVEMLTDRHERDGARASRLWYWRQAVGFLLRGAAARRVARADEGREAVMRGWFEDLGRDLRVTLRGLKKRPTFAAVAVATLALGIGANAAIFTLVSAHFLAPLPYERPDELVLLWETEPNST